MLATQYHNADHSLWRLDKPHQPERGLPSPRMSGHFITSPAPRPSGWPARFESQEAGKGQQDDRASLSAIDKKSPDHSHAHMPPFSRTSLPQPVPSKEYIFSSGARALANGDASVGIDHIPESNESSQTEAQARKETDLKENDEDCVDDEDGLDGESEHSQRLRSASERVAARRKMKRFRLTHQQTRFLMSEFVKQPHPDAAHRDRLSRQIPGLGPRQVQVWFQNRRAKIKRLNVEDRDRVIRMRAVPDEFDTVQALHSPYGAVHGYGPSLSTSPDLGQQTYARGPLGRPLLVDVRRSNLQSKTAAALTPPYDGIGFGQGAGSSDVTSNLSSSSSERFPYYVTSSLDPNSRVPASYPGAHSLNSPQFRDSVARPRTGSTHSAIRSGAMENQDFRIGQNSSPAANECQQPIFSSPSNGYDGEYYSGQPANSPQGVGLDNRTRFTPSTTFSGGLDSDHHYRQAGSSTTEAIGLSGHNRSGSPHYASTTMYATSYPPPQIPGANCLLPRSPGDNSPYHSLPTAQALAAASYHNTAQPATSINHNSAQNPSMNGYYGQSVLPYGHG